MSKLHALYTVTRIHSVYPLSTAEPTGKFGLFDVDGFRKYLNQWGPEKSEQHTHNSTQNKNILRFVY